MAKRTFIIGGGRFGTHLATRLSELGCEVTLADSNSQRVQDLAEEGFHAVELDGEDATALRTAGVLDAEVVVVTVGENIKSSVLATLTLKELNARRIICRAVDERHAAVLERLGADYVIVPGRDMAHRLAESIRHDSFSTRLPLPGEFQLGEVKIGEKFAGKPLSDLRLPGKFKVSLVLVTRRRPDASSDTVQPTPDFLLHVGDIALVAGRPDHLDKFEADNRE